MARFCRPRHVMPLDERMKMDDATIRKCIRGTNFFHHSPHVYLSQGVTSLDNPSAVVRDGINFLNRCETLEPTEFKRRYKGTPFYWIGCASFLANDFETAAFLFDASASEDMREVREGVHPEGRITPALRFLRAEGDHPDQAAQALTQHLQRQLQAAIDDYNNRPGRSHIPLKLSDSFSATHPGATAGHNPFDRLHFLLLGMAPQVRTG